MDDTFRSRSAGGDHRAAFYESYFLEAAHPDGDRAIWIRYTTHRARGGTLAGTLWLTDFRRGRVHRAQQRALPVGVLPGGGIGFGESGHVGPEGAVGVLDADADGARSTWSLGFTGDEAPLVHLGNPRLYRLPIPRTKVTSPLPAVWVSGTASLFGDEVALDGWRGVVGHNWGAQHADRWLWLHGSGFDGDPTAWIDLAVARVRLGPILTPWVAVGGWCVGGRRTMVRRRVRPVLTIGGPADGIEVDLSGLGKGVRVVARAAADTIVDWTYDDPAGGTRTVRNGSLAAMDLGLGPGHPRPGSTTTGVVEHGTTPTSS